MPRQRRSRLKNRSGFTLIMMAFALTVIAGCAALAIDASLMYGYRAQLARTADATALAGVIALANGAGAGSADVAVQYATLNPVSTSTTTLAIGDVVPGTWTQGGGFVATGSWTTGNPFAVKTTTRYGGGYIFARFFGFTTKNLTATAVAVRGSARGSNCVRPWAFPYQSMLDKLYAPGSKTPSYNLTADDVARLAALGAGSDGSIDTFEGVRLPPGEYADGTVGGDIPGGSAYRAQIGAQTCAELDALLQTASPPPPSPVIGIGDWLKPESGFKTGPTKQGIRDLCGSDTCSPAMPVIVALYETAGNAPGGHCGGCWKIKYMTKFMLTGYDNSSKSPTGYFVGMVSNVGGFVPVAGPISRNALVQ